MADRRWKTCFRNKWITNIGKLDRAFVPSRAAVLSVDVRLVMYVCVYVCVCVCVCVEDATRWTSKQFWLSCQRPLTSRRLPTAVSDHWLCPTPHGVLVALATASLESRPGLISSSSCRQRNHSSSSNNNNNNKKAASRTRKRQRYSAAAASIGNLSTEFAELQRPRGSCSERRTETHNGRSVLGPLRVNCATALSVAVR